MTSWLLWGMNGSVTLETFFDIWAGLHQALAAGLFSLERETYKTRSASPALPFAASIFSWKPPRSGWERGRQAHQASPIRSHQVDGDEGVVLRQDQGLLWQVLRPGHWLQQALQSLRCWSQVWPTDSRFERHPRARRWFPQDCRLPWEPDQGRHHHIWGDLEVPDVPSQRGRLQEAGLAKAEFFSLSPDIRVSLEDIWGSDFDPADFKSHWTFLRAETGFSVRFFRIF